MVLAAHGRTLIEEAIEMSGTPEGISKRLERIVERALRAKTEKRDLMRELLLCDIVSDVGYLRAWLDSHFGSGGGDR